MSHATVLCITPNGTEDELEKLLAPYNEEGNLTEWVEPDPQYPGAEGYHRNPVAKWDWWTVGGRWPDQLRTKEGKHVNSAPKGLLDIEDMRAEGRVVAQSRWDAMDAACRELPVARTWAEIRELFPDDIDAARTAFHDQPRVVALKQLNDWNVSEWLEDYQLGYERFMQLRGLTHCAFVCHAFCGSEGWIEQGRMGWFGMDDSTQESELGFAETVNKLIDALPDDAWLTVVDYHI